MTRSYTFSAPACDYTYCTQWCLKTAGKARVSDMRKVWGRYAPIVKCRGELFLMAHDDFKRLSGRFAGSAVGEKESYYV